MNNAERMDLMRERLQKKFVPEHLEIIDESEQHRGHAGAASGAGHFALTIASQQFKGKSRVEIHREIYTVLNDLIPNEIHALRIKVFE